MIRGLVQTSVPLAIIDVGIVSAVGKLTETTYAALRAGIVRMDEHPVFIDASGEPLCCSPLRWLSQDGELDPISGDRVRRAAELVIGKVLEQWRVPSLEVIVVSGDSWRPLSWEPSRALALASARFPDGTVHSLGLLTEGNAGGLLALEHLALQADQHGHVWGLVVGADSLIHLPTLRELERLNRLKRANRPRGLCPGEGAAALLVCDLR